MEIVFSAEQVTKRYGGVVALADGQLQVQGGEVLALMGANGSGKSTLSKIITGVVAPDRGQLLLNGEPVHFSSPQAAHTHGIAAVYQELSLIPDLSVAENIWLAHEPTRFGRITTSVTTHKTQQLLDLFQGTLPSALKPHTRVGNLAPDERQIVEILKTLSLEPRLMILDEATASLDSQQVERLFQLVEQWKAQGMAIVMVTHRMEEVFRFADRATVLRNGAFVGAVVLSETSETELVQLMIEGSVPPQQARATATATAVGKTRIAVQDLSTAMLRNVSLQINAGEILGLGGLGGQGQAELLRALFGAIAFTGSLLLDGKPVQITNPRQAIRQQIAFVPGDRGREGLLGIRSILENFQLPSWRSYGWFLRMGQARADAEAMAEKLHVVMAALDAPVSSLSGGNAQKIVLGKWLLQAPHILLLNDPTKGVDVGAKGEFYRILTELREQGVAVVLYSSDDDELLGLSDRILVFHDGRITAELAGEQLQRTALVAASMGAVHGEAA